MLAFHRRPSAWTRLLLLAALAIAPAQTCWGQSGPKADSQERIVSVEVRGNRYIETATVLSKVLTQKGELLNRGKISRDLRRLYATGFFSDIRVFKRIVDGGVRLIFEVKENPLVAELELVGNDEIADKDLKPRLKLKTGRIFNAANMAADRYTIRRAYLKEGYYQVDVDIKARPRKDGRVDITMRVREGEITHIKRIRFVGNHAFSNDELQGEIASRQSDFMSWFTDRDVFERERLVADAQLIRQFYLNRGYLDANVESTLISLSADKLWFYLTFNIHEGQPYRIGKIDMQGDLVPSRDALMALITLNPGELYSLEKMKESIEAITVKVGDEGYAFANVTPLFRRNITVRTVDITFDIEKGREVYIERIEISGNHKTEDKVLRRELRQIEGERFSASKQKRSKTRLKRLDMFEDIRISLPKGSAPDLVNMKVDVDEKQTGTLAAGVGYSQLEKTFFTGRVEERNFLGKGVAVNFNGEIGSITQNFTLSMTDPYFLDEELSVSINAFKTETDLQSITSYTQDNYGGGLSFGIPITEHLSYSVGYQFTRTNLSNIPTTASLILQSQAGVQTTGELLQVLRWDTRDAVMAPSQGHVESLRFGVAGLGGSNRFFELQASSKSYFPLGGDFTLSPTLKARYIRDYGGRVVPIYRRYSLGGIGTLRGFDSFGVTIRDAATGDVIGGNKTVTASVDLFFPLPYMETSGFRGVLFADTGTIADFTEPLRFSEVRVSVGFAIEWISPVGPLGLVWGFPIRSQLGDLERTFEFALGVSF